MKKRLKIKQLLLGIGLSILGLLTFNSVETNAVGVYPVSATNNLSTESNHVFAGGNRMYYAYNSEYYSWDFENNVWDPVTFVNAPTNLDGKYVAYINGSFYFSSGTYATYKLNLGSNTWSVYNWNSKPSTLNMNNVYRLGDNYYYTNGFSTNYVLNETTNSWISHSWADNSTGPENGANVVKIGENYYSMGGNSASQKIYDFATNKWLTHTWSVSRTSMYGGNMWSYSGDYYFSQNGEHRKLDISTNAWNIITLDGFYYFSGGNNVVYKNVPNGEVFVFNYGTNYIISDTPISSGGGYTEEDLENAYNEGFNEGNNNLLRVTGCQILSIEGQSPDIFGYSGDCNETSRGTTYNAYDNINNIVNLDNLTQELIIYSDIKIKFDVVKNPYFSGQLMLYAKEQTGLRISLYNNDVLVETHLVQALNGITYSFYPITMDIQFNSIVIEYEDYFVAPHEFGLIQTNTYAPISEYNYNRGYNVGYTAGNESGNNIAGIIGAIFVGPINMLSTIFNFEFLGINLAGFILSLTTLLVVIWLIKRFI